MSDLLLIATPTYADPFAREWHPDLRLTTGFLRRGGMQVDFAAVPSLGTLDRIRRHVSATEPATIFIDLNEESRATTLVHLPTLRAAFPHAHLLLGGIPATLERGDLLQLHREIDCLVEGERDVTLLDLLRRRRAGASLHDVPGTRWRGTRNVRRPLIADLDLLGPMAQDGIGDLVAGVPPDERTGFLVASRGCYGNCSFCGVPSFYRRPSEKPWRGRSAAAVVDEMEDLGRRFGIGQFIFQDDNFIGPGAAGRHRARELAGQIRSRGLRVRYFMCCRLDDAAEDVIATLRESGLTGLGVSVESTSQESLNLLRKGLKATSIYASLDILERLRMPCEVNMIFLDPYLTLAGVRGNLALLEHIRRSEYLSYSDAFPFNELKPFAWSPIAARLRAEGLLDEATDTARFKDPAVGRLATFIRRLRRRIPIGFKTALPFAPAQGSSRVDAFDPADDPFTRCSAGLRHWLGLAVLPRYISAACDVLEADAQVERKLDSLACRFDNEMEPLVRCSSAPPQGGCSPA